MASRPESTIVRLCVGGVPFVSSRSTLMRHSDSFFAKATARLEPTTPAAFAARLLVRVMVRRSLRGDACRLMRAVAICWQLLGGALPTERDESGAYFIDRDVCRTGLYPGLATQG